MCKRDLSGEKTEPGWSWLRRGLGTYVHRCTCRWPAKKCVCVCAWACTCECMQSCRCVKLCRCVDKNVSGCQKRVSKPSELEALAVVIYLVWVVANRQTTYLSLWLHGIAFKPKNNKISSVTMPNMLLNFLAFCFMFLTYMSLSLYQKVIDLLLLWTGSVWGTS